MEKHTTARKNYLCNHCLKPINIGDTYKLIRGKAPTHNDDDIQTGFEYYQYRLCLRPECPETEQAEE